MFVRLLRLPDEERSAHDLSSHELAIHAAAPCPVPVKQQMIEWWGPILYEYYAGTEGNGSTAITSEEWLEHPGSVGRARAGTVHIIGPDGEELPPGQEGAIYFSGGGTFEYHGDPEKTEGPASPAASRRSATSATSTRTATSTSPTARPT
jgi:long-chain acyl-CoA synthetase